jgi:hypothetical protein
MSAKPPTQTELFMRRVRQLSHYDQAVLLQKMNEVLANDRRQIRKRFTVVSGDKPPI